MKGLSWAMSAEEDDVKMPDGVMENDVEMLDSTLMERGSSANDEGGNGRGAEEEQVINVADLKDEGYMEHVLTTMTAKDGGDDKMSTAASTSEAKSDDEYSFCSTVCDDEQETSSVEGFEDLAKSFDMKMLRSCIEKGSSVLDQVDGKDVVLVVGKTGVGKSLFIQGVAGKKIVSVTHEISRSGEKVSSQVFEAEDSLPGFEVGHEKVSKTRSINVFVRSEGMEKRGLFYLDSPGFEDTDGPEVDIATSVMLSQVSKRAKSLRFVVLINYASLLEDRGGAMRAVLKLAHTFVADFAKDKKCFMFLITHSNEVEMPEYSLVAARSFLAKDLLRIKMGTNDPDIEMVLKFMHKSITKGYPFVDVLHPLLSDFEAVSGLIETKLSTVRNPALVVNCGLTPQSKMKLTGQLQRMLYTMRGLLHEKKDSNHDVEELKQIRDSFQYLKRFIGIEEVNAAFLECENLLEKHLCTQRLILEAELKKATEKTGHVGIKNLKGATNMLAAFSDGRANTDYIEKRIGDVVRGTHSCVMEFSFDNLEDTLRELDTLKAWSESFAKYVAQYEEACQFISTKIEDIVSDVMGRESGHEGLIAEKVVDWAQNIVELQCVLEVKELEFHRIDTAGCSEALASSKARLLALAGCWGASTVIIDKKQGELWSDLPAMLSLAAQRAKRLELACAVFEKAQACPEVSERMACDLNDLKSSSLKAFQALCQPLLGKLECLPQDVEKKLSCLSALATSFDELCSPLSKVQQPYQAVIETMSSQLHVMSVQLDYSARACHTDGMHDGSKEAEQYLSLKSYIWFDTFNNHSSVQDCCDSVQIVYQGRMESIMDETAKKSQALRVGSESTVSTLQACHHLLVEIKQFEQFESMVAGRCDLVQEKKKTALVGLRRYSQDLVEKTKRWCANWYGSLQAKELDEARVLTETLDRVLAEIEMIESFSCFPRLKQAATEAKDCILHQFKTAKDFVDGELEKPLAYEMKAYCLACIATINGFLRTDNFLPNINDYKEKARSLVSADARKIQSLLEESPDSNEIDECLEAFECARVLDAYTSNEATNQLRPLLSLREKKVDETGKLLEAMIEREDFKGIGKFLKPLHRSKDLIKKQQFEQHARTISSKMKSRASEVSDKLNLLMSREDVESVADLLRIMKEASKEIGFFLNSSELMLSREIDRLEQKLCNRLQRTIDAMLSGCNSGDFYSMGKNHHFALMIIDHGKPSLTWRIKSDFRNANKKMEAATSDLSDHVAKFHSSLFRESALLERWLSSLKIAANSVEPELPNLKELYATTVERLSQETNCLLQNLYEGVNAAGSYDDGIQALEALGRAKERGLQEHMAPLPFNPENVLDGWKDKQAKLEDLDISSENVAQVLKRHRSRLDKLKHSGFMWRWAQGPPASYKRLQRRLEGKCEKKLEQGLESLWKRDWVALRKCLDFLNLMVQELSQHIPALEGKRVELEKRILATFMELCKESVKIFKKADCFEASSSVSFEAIFPELRECVLNFIGVLNCPNAAKEFCLVNQLVHDHLKEGISQLNDAFASHNFSQARALVRHNRTHGAFLADRYALLFEELKQRNTLQDEKWLSQIWKICCETFWCGRDLKNIKACAVLGVLPSASEEDIRKAYRHKARQVHPDKNACNDDDAGKEFRRVKDAHDLLLEARSKEETNSQLFDSLLHALPGALKKEVRDHLREQKYDLVELLLEKFPDFQMVCNLVCPPLDFDTIRNDVVKTILDRVHEGKIDVETFWNDRKYKELNHSIGDLKQMEHHLKSFPDVFPESWNKGIVEKVEEEIESLGKKARSYLKDKRTAADHEDDFRRCFIQMGSVLVELQSFKDFTKSVMYDVLESCLNADWGFSYLFELGLSFHRGDDRIAQTLLSEFTHFKEVITMVWNEETVQKPVEDTVADIRGVRRGSGEAISIDKKALLKSFHSFDSSYKLLLGEYLPADTDKRKLANKTIAMANSLKPLGCSSGWDAHVKNTIPQILAGVFALFTVLKSGESFNRIQEGSADAQKIGQKLLMRPHNIQVLTLLHLLGCGTSDTSLENHLMQIRTGEGKSIILGAAVTILALLGFKVRCVCYSEYLSKRDYSLFEEVFKYLGLDRLVTYSKITALSEDTTAGKGDIRALTESLLRQKPLQWQPDSTAPMVGSYTKASPIVKKMRLEGEGLWEENSASHSKGGSDEVTKKVSSPTKSGAQEISVKSSTSFQATEGLEEILLVDEVDVFFGPDFYGQTYNKVMELHEPEIAAILTDIWTKNNHGGRKQKLTDVQATSPYQSLVQKMPMFQFLIDNEIRLMLDHVSRVDEEPYYLDADNDRIGYKVLDTISYQVTYGYRTVFAYLKEANEGNLKDEEATLKQVLSMPIQCGQFSYSNISPSRILGVSGTLEAMGEYEKDVLQGYGVEKFIFVPSVYGKSNFVFDKAGDGIFIEPNKSDYFQKICDEVINKIHQRRAVIVFFENIERLDEFKSSPFFPKLGRNKAILSENMDPSAKEFAINKAATSGQITLSPAVFGRGTDFFCKDDRVQDGGGVHIIQTFLSQEKSEEVQIQGRTSRQGKKGSYQLVLWEDDLCKDFDSKRGEKDSVPRNQRYDWLCDARDKRHSQHWKKVDENLKAAKRRDADTHEYFDSLLAGSRHDATKLFKELYLAINKPPIPDTISIDVALLIDITGSMAPYCKPTLSTIQCLVSGNSSILNKLKSQFPETEIKLRLGVLGYRDLDDKNSQFCESTWNGGAHFTDSITDAIASIGKTLGSPSGGHDLAEDHLGAITRSLTWNGANDWSSPIKLILLFTDAPAHGFVPSSSSQLPNADGYSVRHPNGLTSASVADSLVSKGVNLITCSYNPFATSPFEKQLANDYGSHPSNSEGREIKSISMIPQSAGNSNTGQTWIGDHPRHIVFILDESGSMNGHWRGVVEAFQKYIARRLQNQNESDLVSVVQFDSNARVTVRQQIIGSASQNLGQRGGGTQFAPAAIEGSQLAATTPTSHRPTIVFMSDGGSNDAGAAASTFSALNQQVRQKHGCDLDLHVIAFGCGADTQQLQHISTASPKGRVYLSSDTVQLTNIFTNIAGGQQVATVLQEEIGKEISEAVSDTLSIGYLS